MSHPASAGAQQSDFCDGCPVPRPDLEFEERMLTYELDLWLELEREYGLASETYREENCRILQFKIDCIVKAFCARRIRKRNVGYFVSMAAAVNVLSKAQLQHRTIPSGFGDWINSKYPPHRMLGWIGEYKCSNRNCLHYIYGFNLSRDLEKHYHQTHDADRSTTRNGGTTLVEPGFTLSIDAFKDWNIAMDAPRSFPTSPVVSSEFSDASPSMAPTSQASESRIEDILSEPCPTFSLPVPGPISRISRPSGPILHSGRSPSKLSVAEAPSSEISGSDLRQLVPKTNSNLSRQVFLSPNLADDVSDSGLQDLHSSPGTGRPSRTRKHPADFHCDQCPKHFTRAHTLRAHLRVHAGDRPFACIICGKSFTRNDDRKRHEHLHSAARAFSCGIELSNGHKWGCGRRFARTDGLRAHLSSKIGRRCLLPILNGRGQSL